MVGVARVRTARQRAEVLALGHAVLVIEQGAESSDVRDAFDDDPTTLHCMVVGPDGGYIGAGRLATPVDTVVDGVPIRGNPAIDPIVVARGTRGTGVARAIVAYLEAEALARFGRNGSVAGEVQVPAGVR